MRIVTALAFLLVGLLVTGASVPKAEAGTVLSPVIAHTHTSIVHTHTCPCWRADDAASQHQLCNCGIHEAGAYGVECPTENGNAIGDNGGSPVGGTPITPLKRPITRSAPPRQLYCKTHPAALVCK